MPPETLGLLLQSGVIARAKEFEGRGEWGAAEGVYRAFLDSYPADSGPDNSSAVSNVLGLLGLVLVRTQRFDEALSHFDTALSLDPTSPWLHNNRGGALEVLGRKTDAILAYRMAVLLRPPADRSASHVPGNFKRLLGQVGRLSMGPKPPAPEHIRLLAMTVAPDWWSIARLTSSLSAAGFDVAALCLKDSYLAQTGFVCERYFMDGEGDLVEAFLDAVAGWNPYLIIPGDEFSTHFLHHMACQDVPDNVRQVIGRSCGDACFYGTVSDKGRTLEVAGSLEIRHPEQTVGTELAQAIDAYGYPVALKMSVGMAGLTVRICQDQNAATIAMAELNSLILPAYAAPASLIVQQSIDGFPASIAFVAWEGRILDAFVYRSVETSTECGPSCVVKRIESPEIEQVAQRLVDHFGFTGFGGFDFMVETESGHAYLLEMNPRVTITTHLGVAFGHDLATALYAALTGNAAPPIAQGHETIALFPHEWFRDANSPHLKRHFADVPWDDPGLLKDVMARRPMSVFPVLQP